MLTHYGDCWDNYQVDFTYPNDVFPSENYYRPDLSDPPIRLSGVSEITAPDTPGCGAAPNPERLGNACISRETLSR